MSNPSTMISFDSAHIYEMPIVVTPSNIDVRRANSGSFLTARSILPIIITGYIDDWVKGNNWELMGLSTSLIPTIIIQFVGTPGNTITISGISIDETGASTTFSVTLVMTGAPVILAVFTAVHGIRTKAWVIDATPTHKELRLIRNLAA